MSDTLGLQVNNQNFSSEQIINKDSLLRKKIKRSKRLAQGNLNKDFDLNRIKSKFTRIFEEEKQKQHQENLTSNQIDLIFDNTNINVIVEKGLNKQKTSFLTTNIVTFIKKITIENSKVPENYKNLELTKLLFKITKLFFYNDFELLNFSIYLDKLDWDNQNLSPEKFLLVLGFAVKLKLNQNNHSFIENFKKENPEIYSIYINWIIENKNFLNVRIIEKDLNSKYKALSRPVDYFCKSNLIDYNYIVEKILKMSVTYSENKAVKENINKLNSEAYNKQDSSSNNNTNAPRFGYQSPYQIFNYPNISNNFCVQTNSIHDNQNPNSNQNLNNTNNFHQNNNSNTNSSSHNQNSTIYNNSGNSFNSNNIPYQQNAQNNQNVANSMEKQKLNIHNNNNINNSNIQNISLNINPNTLNKTQNVREYSVHNLAGNSSNSNYLTQDNLHANVQKSNNNNEISVNDKNNKLFYNDNAFPQNFYGPFPPYYPLMHPPLDHMNMNPAMSPPFFPSHLNVHYNSYLEEYYKSANKFKNISPAHLFYMNTNVRPVEYWNNMNVKNLQRLDNNNNNIKNNNNNNTNANNPIKKKNFANFNDNLINQINNYKILNSHEASESDYNNIESFNKTSQKLSGFDNNNNNNNNNPSESFSNLRRSEDFHSKVNNNSNLIKEESNKNILYESNSECYDKSIVFNRPSFNSADFFLNKLGENLQSSNFNNINNIYPN